MGSLALKRSGLNGIFFCRFILSRSSSTRSFSAGISLYSDAQRRSIPSWKGGSLTSLQVHAGAGSAISGLPFTQLGRGMQVEAAVDDVCAKPTDGDVRTQAAAAALQDYLQKSAGIFLSDAMTVVDKAPLFMNSLVHLANQSYQSKEASDKADFRKHVQTVLKETKSNVLEPVLESIGVVSERFQALLPKLSTEPKDVLQLLFVTRTFQRLGFSRHDIGEMIEGELNILAYCDDEIQAGLQTLRELPLSEEEILTLIKKYPLVLKSEVMNNLGFLVEELSELQAKDVICRKAICDNPGRLHRFSRNGAQQVVKYLRAFGLSGAKVNEILQKHFRLVLSDVEKDLKPKVHFLKDLGVPREHIVKVVRRCPGFFFYSLQDGLIRRLEYFRTLGFESGDFAKVVSRYPAIFSASLENKIKPAVMELETLGLTAESLKKVILYRPSLFAYKLGGEISKLIKQLSEMQCSQNKKVTAFIKLFSRGTEQRTKCEDCLVQHGLSPAEAKEVLEKEPGILGYNEQALSVKIENLTKTLGVPIKNIVTVPEYLSFQFRKRVLRRQRVLAYMKSKGLLGDMLSLKDLVAPTNAQFFKLYVKPHSEDSELSKIWWKNERGTGKVDCFDFIKSSTEDCPELRTS